MNHYVYLLTFNDGMKYVGCRSTKHKPELDNVYLGSGGNLPTRDIGTCQKHILKVFPTREDAILYEIDYIIRNQCVQSDKWYNLRTRTHDRHGSKNTPEHIAKVIESRKGLVCNTRSGERRTAAQKAADAKLRVGLGNGESNPAKAHKGTDNQGFVPWYHISPEGVYTEVLDLTKAEYASKLGVTPRQLSHRFHYKNIHKAATTKPLKGWTFGNLNTGKS